MMDHFTLSVVAGAIAGALDMIPMLAQKLSFRACLSAFCTYLFAGVIIFHSDLPYLPWWADGMSITVAMAIPIVLILAGKERKATPIILLNAVLLGFLLSVAERYFC